MQEELELQPESEGLEEVPYGPDSFSLVLDEDITLGGVGSAVLDRWRQSRYYRKDVPDEEQQDTLDWFLKTMLTNPVTIQLPSTNRYTGKPVLWIPGHIIGSKVWGPQHSRVMVVGKMPGADELESKHVWRGPAGRLLAKMFAQYHLALTECYGTNVIKFSPPYPNMSTLPAEWVKEGLWFLKQEVRIVKPDYILLLGADAVKALFGRHAKLSSYKGTVTEYEGCKVMVANNPSDILRNPEKMDMFRADISLFCRTARGESTKPADVNYTFIHTAEQLESVVEQCMPFDTFAMDCEWSGPNWIEGHLLTIQFSKQPKEAFTVVLRSDISKTEFAPSPAEAVRLLRKLLCRPGVRIVGHNFRADLKFLVDVGLGLADQFADYGFDTMLASHLLAENAEHNLTSCSLRETDMGRYDFEVDQFLSQGYTHGTLPDKTLWEYGAADADATFRLFLVYEQKILQAHTQFCKAAGVDAVEAIYAPNSPEHKRRGAWYPTLLNLFTFIVMPVNKVINEMEMTGLAADADRISAMVAQFAKKRDELQAELLDIVQDPQFNHRSVPQVRRLLYGKPGSEFKDGKARICLGLTPLKCTNKKVKRSWSELADAGEVYYLDEPVYAEADGERVISKEAGWHSDMHQPSTDSESLAMLAEERGCREAGLLRNIRFVDQICKNFLAMPEMVEGEYTFTKGLGGAIARDGRIRTNISQLTETGRWRSYNVNLQNIPKGREGVLSEIFKGDEEVPPVRTCLVPSAGNVLIEADFESAELYVLAYISSDKRMKADLERKSAKGKKISMHSTRAVEMFKLQMDVDKFEELRKSGPESAKLEGLRVAAKSVSFGVPYSRGPKAICNQVRREGVNCTVDDAKGWINNFFDTYVDVDRFLKESKSSVHDPGWLRTPFGRMRRFHEVDDESIMAAQEREAGNFPIQSVVADALSLALVHLYEERNRRGLRFRIVLAVHDAILLDVPYEEAPEAIALLKWAMTEQAAVPGIGLSLGADVTVYSRWNEKASVEILEKCGIQKEK